MKIYSFTDELTRRDKKYINYHCERIINEIEDKANFVIYELKNNKGLKSPDFNVFIREQKIAKLKGALC